MYPNGAYTRSRLFHTTNSPSRTHLFFVSRRRALNSTSKMSYPRGPKSLLFLVK